MSLKLTEAQLKFVAPFDQAQIDAVKAAAATYGFSEPTDDEALAGLKFARVATVKPGAIAPNLAGPYANGGNLNAAIIAMSEIANTSLTRLARVDHSSLPVE